MLRKLLYLFSALLLGAGALSGLQASGADFTDSSATSLNIFAAPDWTAPDVTIVDPGYAVVGTVTVNATASDGDTAIASVAIQRAAHGSGTWTAICTDSTSPYSCSWNTTQVTDGDYDLRAVATDIHGNTKTSALVMTTVINTAGVVLDPVLGPVRGTVTLQGRIVNAGTGFSTIRFQASLSGANSWADIPGCGSAPGPSRTCAADTSFTTGYYDWRAVGTINGNTYYDYETHVLVDNTAPSVSLTVPAAPLSGTVNLTATASDAHSGMVSVNFEYRRSGVTTWTSCATDTSSPYACSLGTAALTDGNYEFRATALDLAGNTTVTGTTTRTVMNSSIVLTAVPATVRGTYGLSATWNGAGSPSVQFQYSSIAAGGWATVCTVNAAPYTCSWNTTALDSQRWYVRATTTVSGTTYEQILSTIVDNEVPNVSLTVPAGTLFGTASLTATADDTDPNVGDESSGLAGVQFEYRPSGVSSWTSCGTDNSSPYACSLDTRSLTDGTYEFRSTATDVAGNTTTTSSQTRSVDNNPWVTVTAPSAGTSYPQGSTITVTADGYSSNGITQMQLQYDPAGAASWTTICTDTLAPYTCNWNTSTAPAVPAGATSIRSVMTRTGGATVTSSSVAITMEQLRASDVQVTNGSNFGTAGQGDVITLTYSTTVNLATIKSGWNGSSTAVSVALNDRTVGSPLVSGLDYLAFSSVNLGQVAFAQSYIQSSTVTFGTSTMAAWTQTVGGRQVTVVTVTLGARTGGTGTLSTQTGPGTTQWTPSATVTDTFGNACSTAVASESGTADADL
jgi:chitinase